MRMRGKVAAAVAVALLCAAADAAVASAASTAAPIAIGATAITAAATKADEPRKPDGSTPLMEAAFKGDVAEATLSVLDVWMRSGYPNRQTGMAS